MEEVIIEPVETPENPPEPLEDEPTPEEAVSPPKAAPKKRGRPAKPKPENPPPKKPVGRPKGSTKKPPEPENEPIIEDREDESFTLMRLLIDRKRQKVHGKAQRYANLLRL